MIFADTFFWIALTSAQDQDHGRAKLLARSSNLGVLCTTEEVLTEYLNYVAGWSTNLRQTAVLNVQSIMATSTVHVVAQSTESFQAGLALYRARLDKGYSLTDCISMMTMGGKGIVEALTNDAHFQQEGFRALFRNRE